MTNLENKTMELVAEYEKLMSDAMQNLGLNSLLNMNKYEFDMAMQTLRLVKNAMELMVLQAKSLDEVHSRLDKITVMLEKKES